MPCSTKSISAFSVAGLVACVVVAILGIVVMTSSIPLNTCGGLGEVRLSKTDQDNVDAALMWLGTPALAGGILGALGGGFGGWGGWSANKCGICSSATLNGISGAFLVIAAMAAAAMSAAFGAVCDEYKCGADFTCGQWGQFTSCRLPDVCCKCEGFVVHQSCKQSIDWVCDMKTKKLLVLVFAAFGLILTIIASALGCGASCCCPASFIELGQTTGGAPPANAMVVGQVVGSGDGSNEK